MTQITHRLNAKEQEEVIKALAELSEKYLDLVWYARKPPVGSEAIQDYLADTPESIKLGCLKAQIKVKEQYPGECEALEDPETGSWEHGFNSGCLAALRLALSALNPTTVIDPAFDGEGEPCELDGLQVGLDQFPSLDA